MNFFDWFSRKDQEIDRLQIMVHHKDLSLAQLTQLSANLTEQREEINRKWQNAEMTIANLTHALDEAKQREKIYKEELEKMQIDYRICQNAILMLSKRLNQIRILCDAKYQETGDGSNS